MNLLNGLRWISSPTFRRLSRLQDLEKIQAQIRTALHELSSLSVSRSLKGKLNEVLNRETPQELSHRIEQAHDTAVKVKHLLRLRKREHELERKIGNTKVYSLTCL